ncbi:MAG: hypothetical protein ABL927_08490 [Bdellovibrionales bacterium]
MKLIKADESYNDKLLQYFSRISLPGTVQYRLQRMFNFFNQYRLQSDDSVTYVLENDKSEIEALATIIFRKVYIDGKAETIGYATDLRVSPTRQAILSWSNHFLPVLETERSARNCKYIFSVVARSQRQAHNAFIRPNHFRRKMPRYHLFRKFQVVSLHGLWPFHDLPLSGIKIRSASESDMESLSEYILTKTADRPLKYFNSHKEFCDSLTSWQDLFIENFILALDQAGNIIGCTAPWSPERVQRIFPEAYEPKAKNLQDILKVFSWFGASHPLPIENKELEVRHLTHLYANNTDIFILFYIMLFSSLVKMKFYFIRILKMSF